MGPGEPPRLSDGRCEVKRHGGTVGSSLRVVAGRVIDLVDELRTLERADRPSPTQACSSRCQACSSRRLAGHHRLRGQPIYQADPVHAHRKGPEDTLLIIGQAQEFEAWARALSSADRPAAPLAREMLANSHTSTQALSHLCLWGSVLDFSVKTGIMGILNVTPDSFYDGGRYLDPHAAVDHAHQMLAEGADIIDIGGQSSRPGSDPVSEAEEADRVLPVVEAVAKSVSAIISVDTYRARWRGRPWTLAHSSSTISVRCVSIPPSWGWWPSTGYADPDAHARHAPDHAAQPDL